MESCVEHQPDALWSVEVAYEVFKSHVIWPEFSATNPRSAKLSI